MYACVEITSCISSWNNTTSSPGRLQKKSLEHNDCLYVPSACIETECVRKPQTMSLVRKITFKQIVKALCSIFHQRTPLDECCWWGNTQISHFHKGIFCIKNFFLLIDLLQLLILRNIFFVLQRFFCSLVCTFSLHEHKYLFENANILKLQI